MRVNVALYKKGHVTQIWYNRLMRSQSIDQHHYIFKTDLSKMFAFVNIQSKFIKHLASERSEKVIADGE